jgi:glycosyltransferase involved in cell wall biosynthesis
MSGAIVGEAALPGITVLCSNYNSARWITGYCESLNEQFLGHFNLVVVDAASTDGSLEMIRAHPFRNDISVNILPCTERISIYKAWNMAIEASTTPWCINVNTDDRLFPSALLTLASYARSEPEVDLFYSPCFVTTDSSHAAYTNMFVYPEYTHAALLRECICGPFPMWKRETIVSAGMFDTNFRFSADHEMWLRLSSSSCRFRRIPEVIGGYFYNPEGVSTDVRTKQARVAENEKILSLYSSPCGIRSVP